MMTASFSSNNKNNFGFVTDIPDTDVSQISFYLKCCVLGCGLGLDRIPNLELLDYRNAESFPIEWKQLVFDIALQEPFALQCVLNSHHFFVDDNALLLPNHASNIFHRTSGSGGDETVMMICTSEWLNTFYIKPLERYIKSVAEAHGWEPPTTQQTLPGVYTYVTTPRQEQLQQEFTDAEMDKDIDSVVVESEETSQDCIPMVTAVLLDAESPASSSTTPIAELVEGSKDHFSPQID